MKLFARTTGEAKEAAERLVGLGINFKFTNCSGTEFGAWIEFDDWTIDAAEVAYIAGDLSCETD